MVIYYTLFMFPVSDCAGSSLVVAIRFAALDIAFSSFLGFSGLSWDKSFLLTPDKLVWLHERI